MKEACFSGQKVYILEENLEGLAKILFQSEDKNEKWVDIKSVLTIDDICDECPCLSHCSQNIWYKCAEDLQKSE